MNIHEKYPPLPDEILQHVSAAFAAARAIGNPYDPLVITKERAIRQAQSFWGIRKSPRLPVAKNLVIDLLDYHHPLWRGYEIPGQKSTVFLSQIGGL